jgi:hypothetical protein
MSLANIYPRSMSSYWSSVGQNVTHNLPNVKNGGFRKFFKKRPLTSGESWSNVLANVSHNILPWPMS